jgi:hypothetical protein
VDRLINAGGQILKNNREFQRLLSGKVSEISSE